MILPVFELTLDFIDIFENFGSVMFVKLRPDFHHNLLFVVLHWMDLFILKLFIGILHSNSLKDASDQP